MISFTVTKEEHALIVRAADRATRLAKKHGGAYGTLDAEMDITAANANGCPLDLAKLLAFDDFNFVHDVFGIREHIDRDTGEVHRFLPRCARPQSYDPAEDADSDVGGTCGYPAESQS